MDIPSRSIESPYVERDSSGLVVNYDSLVGNMLADQASDDPDRQARALQTGGELGIDTLGDGK